MLQPSQKEITYQAGRGLLVEGVRRGLLVDAPRACGNDGGEPMADSFEEVVGAVGEWLLVDRDLCSASLYDVTGKTFTD